MEAQSKCGWIHQRKYLEDAPYGCIVIEEVLINGKSTLKIE